MENVRIAADVSNGTLFHYFPTKDNLAAALYLDALRSYQAAVLGALERYPRPKRAVGGAVEAHLSWVARHPDEARCLHEMRQSATESAGQEIFAVNALMQARLRAWLDRQVKAGLVRDLPLDVFVPIAIGPVMEFTKSWLRKPQPKRLAEVAPLFADAAWRAVRCRESKK
jgi:AcrR family transcriptional regulator